MVEYCLLIQYDCFELLLSALEFSFFLLCHIYVINICRVPSRFAKFQLSCKCVLSIYCLYFYSFCRLTVEVGKQYGAVQITRNISVNAPLYFWPTQCL